MKIVFNSLRNGSIFEPEFQNLSDENGTIEFKHMSSPGGLAVVYAPNGTGKSSLAQILEAEKSTEMISFAAKDDSDKKIKPESLAFHIIQDQIKRNVIKGSESDYLIGKQIRREYNLREKINIAFANAYMTLGLKYKNEFKVTKVGNFFLKRMEGIQKAPYPIAFQYIRSIVNNKDKGKTIDQNEFVSFVRDIRNKRKLSTIDIDKKNWLIKSISENSKIVETIVDLDDKKVISGTDVVKIERHDDAIGILKKYHHLDSCVVCDNNDFDGVTLLKSKVANRNIIYNKLDDITKDLLDTVLKDSGLSISDPFEIKRILRNFINNGESIEFQELQHNLKYYVETIINEIIEALFHCFNEEFYHHYDEYINLIQTQPSLDSEELLFIEEVINENIGKNITIEREPESKNYRLKLGDKNLIGTEREAMELSSGEQNFISLAFELLLARHSKKEYIILDDPISSFDSVYKNKIAYCIIKFLEGKKQIVLTHNTDLIRLLDVQLNNCFNLYILNNVEHGQNGFIHIGGKEKKLLINLHELIKFFQNHDHILENVIRNRKQFLMSMIPFMRGYAHISLDPEDVFGKLSNVMHGYESKTIDAVPIYKKLFGYDFTGSEEITVSDILTLNCDTIDILDKTQYPLLAETLRQTLIYYHLRMTVEKELVAAFRLHVHEMVTLNQIIQRAFHCTDDDPNFERKRAYRVFFASRKTLLNEFNHFEGNMNIFQPAIDINPVSLQKEILSIKKKLEEIKQMDC